MTNVDDNIRPRRPAFRDGFRGGRDARPRRARHDGSKSRLRPKTVPHFTPAERAARGRAARGELPRSAHADWEPGPRRRDPVDLLEEQAQTRLPELGPIRYGRMLVSPFTFFRGAAYLMAADLADGPRTGLHAQLCGDAHLSNFGIFAAPDRRLVFSINDFDETLPGPFEWDVKRLAASFAVAGRDRGFKDAIRRSVVMAAVREYREAMARFAEMRNIDVWYTRLDVAGIRERLGAAASRKQMKRFQTNVAKAHTKDSLRALTKLCRTVDGELRIVGNPPLVTPIEDVLPGAEQDHLEDVVRRMIRTYRRTLPRDRRHLLESYRYVHAARKVVGVGSVGARAWILLMVGRDDNDPLFLQFKEAQASVLEPFLGKSQYAQHGQRVVEGQRMMQAAPDIMLGWERIVTIDGQKKDFYIRQLWDAKGSAEVELMDPSALEAYGQNLRLDARESPRPLGRQDRDRRLSRQRRRLRSRHGHVRRDVRRPERSRLPRTAGGSGVRPRRGRDGRLTASAPLDAPARLGGFVTSSSKVPSDEAVPGAVLRERKVRISSVLLNQAGQLHTVAPNVTNPTKGGRDVAEGAMWRASQPSTTTPARRCSTIGGR